MAIISGNQRQSEVLRSECYLPRAPCRLLRDLPEHQSALELHQDLDAAQW